jgi:hypothetical protein
VQKEYDVLFHILKEYVLKYNYHYRILYEINLSIWELQDKFHGKETMAEEGARICHKVLIDNDRRFRVKAKINAAAKSNLREQKGYNLKKCVFFSHLGLGDMFWMNGAVRYLATDYDEVLVICKKSNQKNAEAMYSDDPTIKLLLVEDFKELTPWTTKQFIFSDNGYTVFGCGGFSNRPKPLLYNLPQSFYDDISIPFETRLTYFHVPRTEAALELAKKITVPYIIVHAQSSLKTLDITGMLRNRGETRLILDVNKNQYEKGTVEWELAEEVVGKPINDYTYLLEGADELYMIESSIYCMASHLDLSKVKKRVCYEPWGNNAERLGTFTTGHIN